MSITNKSVILRWNSEGVNQAPTHCGVYVFRTIPSLNGIIYIGATNDLQTELKQHFSTGDVPETVWFDWYETSNLDFAKALQRTWVEKYTPKYNR